MFKSNYQIKNICFNMKYTEMYVCIVLLSVCSKALVRPVNSEANHPARRTEAPRSQRAML